MREWKASDVAQELLDLFEMDSDRTDEGWGTQIRDNSGPSEFEEFDLLLGKQRFNVTVRKVR